MTKRDFIILACKIVAIVFIINAATGGLIANLIAVFNADGSMLVLISNLCALTGKLLVIGVCVLLWLKAELIAKRFFHASTAESMLLIDDNFAPPIIALAGIIIFMLSISLLFSHFGRVLTPSRLVPPVGMTSVEMLRHLNAFEIIHIAADIFQMAIGIGLFYGAKAIFQMLRHRIRGVVPM